ncbi:nucleotidyltransferase family protein [Kallotenue papyrolyticum]|uniref:nucleotidyltransferase family protein n=1 Tax=Kallotenue papyrolyticum TaxID=1325125 RepID=UPI00047855A8|nr:nucleotidyltransferase family protein [Kallotenue papyrolyticum]
MKAIILAAGYATRLRPLTENRAKPLLPIAGRPMLDYIYAKIVDVPDVDAIHLVTNHRFAADFAAWARQKQGRLEVMVHDDGTLTNEDRLGAIGDIRFTVARAGLDDDLLVIAGDNLFDFSLSEYVAFWRDKAAAHPEGASCIALYQCPDLELVKQYSIVELAENDRVVSFVEKPEQPTTNTVGIATYIYDRRHVPLLETYLGEGNSPDQPGKFIQWLHKRVPVYGYRFAGDWMDIGNKSQLLEADNKMRRRLGLPEREAYSVEE